jgi:hypothetical protein
VNVKTHRPYRHFGVCRSIGATRKKYKRLWARMRRRDPLYWNRELAAFRRRRREKPLSTRARNRADKAKWLADPANRRRAIGYWRGRHRAARTCFFCHRYKRSARMQRIERMVPVDTSGTLRRVEVMWCGKC